MTPPNEKQQPPDTDADREPELNAEAIMDLEPPNDDAEAIRAGKNPVPGPTH